ncbi:MAG: DUF3347 domain-containing protein [Gillisia sp.]
MKKNIIALSLILGAAFSLVSCGDNSKKEKQTITVNQESNIQAPDVEDVDTTGTAKFKDEQTARIFKDYIEVKSAFVASDASKAGKAADQLLSDLKEDANKDLKDAAQKIARETDINKQREAFSNLTAAMGKKLEGALKSGEVYKLYCPMAFQGKGDYWYSNSKEIKNPYFGQKMLTCGRVDKTIE